MAVIFPSQECIICATSTDPAQQSFIRKKKKKKKKKKPPRLFEEDRWTVFWTRRFAGTLLCLLLPYSLPCNQCNFEYFIWTPTECPILLGVVLLEVDLAHKAPSCLCTCCRNDTIVYPLRVRMFVVGRGWKTGSLHCRSRYLELHLDKVHTLRQPGIQLQSLCPDMDTIPQLHVAKYRRKNFFLVKPMEGKKNYVGTCSTYLPR